METYLRLPSSASLYLHTFCLLEGTKRDQMEDYGRRHAISQAFHQVCGKRSYLVKCARVCLERLACHVPLRSLLSNSSFLLFLSFRCLFCPLHPPANLSAVVAEPNLQVSVSLLDASSPTFTTSTTSGMWGATSVVKIFSFSFDVSPGVLNRTHSSHLRRKYLYEQTVSPAHHSSPTQHAICSCSSTHLILTQSFNFPLASKTLTMAFPILIPGRPSLVTSCTTNSTFPKHYIL